MIIYELEFQRTSNQNFPERRQQTTNTMHPPEMYSLLFDENHETFDNSSKSSTPSPALDYHTPPEMPVTSTPTTPSSPSSMSESMAEQLHKLNNEQLLMTIMASSVLLQSRLKMIPIDEVDKVLAAYEALMKLEGERTSFNDRSHASIRRPD